MLNENDLIVFDQEYTNAAKQINDYCAAIVELIEKYSRCVNTILEKAIKDEKITTRLQELISNVEAVKPEVESIGEQASASCSQFVSDIDNADKFLY